MGLVVRRSDGVRVLDVCGPWTAAMDALVRAGEVDRLVLNYVHGFKEGDLGFLEGLPLRELEILDWWMMDLEPIYSLGSTLEVLNVTTPSSLKVDLYRLPKLHTLGASWVQVADSIAGAPAVRDAFFLDYRPADLTPLEPWGDLERLRMKDRPKLKSLAGLSAFPKLRELGIFLAVKLADFGELEGRSEIEKLEFDSCKKIKQIDFLSGCTGLQELSLANCGDIDSLAPIQHLKNLERLWMHEDTKILDGDLSPILELPRLSRMSMMNRRAYRPSVKEIKAQLGLE